MPGNFNPPAPSELNGKGTRALNFHFSNHAGPFNVGVQYATSSFEDGGVSKAAMVSLLQSLSITYADDLGYNSPPPVLIRSLRIPAATKSQLQSLASNANVIRLHLLTNPS